MKLANYRIHLWIVAPLLFFIGVLLVNILFPSLFVAMSSGALIALQFTMWIAYLLFFLYLILVVVTQSKRVITKVGGSLLCLFLIYLPIFPIINIINIILMLFCTNPPFIRDISAEFPEHKAFEQNYKKITDEYNQYIAKNPAIDCFRNNNPLLREIDTIDKEKDYCWRTLYLKKGGHMIPETVSAFPLTAKLLANDQIDNAFFSILDPHVEIKPHTGYYKGYLRYHVGLIIPEEGGQRPYIVCGGERYEWTEGKGVLFDDMYLHYVNNPTSKPRVILYLDIKRRGMPYFLQGVTDFGNYLIENSVILQFFVKNQHQQSALV